MDRITQIDRKTNETEIFLKLNIDGTGTNSIDTGVGFLNHMLAQIARHGFFDVDIKAKGDYEVDDHHTAEDTGIVLGAAITQALGNKKGIKRYAHIILPMDETLMVCAIDISGRAYFMSDVSFPTEKIGGFDTELVEEFFKSLAYACGMNLHFKQMTTGGNSHHIAESMFKSFGRALDCATQIDSRLDGILSTKGIL